MKKKVIKKRIRSLGGITLSKLQRCIEETLVKAVKEMPAIKVLCLNRNHFNKKLSTVVGFGFQDLKSPYKELVGWLISEYKNVSFIPTNVNTLDIDVFIKI